MSPERAKTRSSLACLATVAKIKAATSMTSAGRNPTTLARVLAKHLSIFLLQPILITIRKETTLTSTMDIVTKLFSLNLDVEPNTDTLKGLSKTLNSAGTLPPVPVLQLR